MEVKLHYENLYPQKLVGYKKAFGIIAKTALSELNKDGVYDLSVTIVDDETIHKYNKEYRNIDRTTDVISFAFNDNSEDDYIKITSEIPNMLGDIFISFPKAKTQAKEYGHSIYREMCFLFTHGFLHLLGYDHQNTKGEKEMFDLQDKILNKLNITR